MWIRNGSGDLINTDHLTVVYFEKGFTKAHGSGDMVVICDYDARETIAEALAKNKTLILL